NELAIIDGLPFRFSKLVRWGNDEGLERAFLIASRETRLSHQLFATVFLAATARPRAFADDQFPPRAAAKFANLLLKLSQFQSHFSPVSVRCWLFLDAHPCGERRGLYGRMSSLSRS